MTTATKFAAVRIREPSAGRESAHGLGAFSEQWWCPIPLLAIVLGLLTLAAGSRTSIP